MYVFYRSKVVLTKIIVCCNTACKFIITVGRLAIIFSGKYLELTFCKTKKFPKTY